MRATVSSMRHLLAIIRLNFSPAVCDLQTYIVDDVRSGIPNFAEDFPQPS